MDTASRKAPGAMRPMSRRERAELLRYAKREEQRRAKLTAEQRAAEDAKRDAQWAEAIATAQAAQAKAVAESGAIADVESIYDLIEQAKQQPACAANRTHWQYWGSKSESRWYGLDTVCDFNAVARIAMDGWQSGMQRIERELDDLARDIAPPQSMRRRKVWSDQGDSVDIHRVNSGNIGSAWQRTQRRNVAARRDIKIVISSIVSGGTESDVLFYRGAAAVVLADLLTNAGYNVSVWAAFVGTTFASEPVECRVQVKPCNAPLDKGALAVAAMPAFFRCLGHRWIAAHTKRDQRGTGIMPGQYQARDGEVGGTHAIYSRDSAKRWVEQELSKLMAEVAE